MFSKTSILALFAAVAIAAPPVSIYGYKVFMCEHAEYQGECNTFEFKPGECFTNLGSLNNNVTSLNSLQNKCRYYTDENCMDDGGNIPTDGEICDIRKDPKLEISSKNDRISSFDCADSWD